MSNQNKYGLILRDKSKLTFQASHNVFGNDSESDDDTGKKPVLLQPSVNTNRQSKISQEKAIIDDPTVYQYDEIYDSMAKEKESKKEKKKDEKKPKYIDNLMKSANKRKLENERRVERQVQKEREKEGDEFADKEVFVTSAYKKKLEEIRIEEEKEKREEYLESIGDVTKQRDLGGFYRHLYEQKLGSDKTPKSEQTTKDGTPENEEETNDSEFKPDDVSANLKQSKQRNYRKRKFSSDTKLSEGEIEDSENEINFSNLDDIKSFKKSKLLKENVDADSDFSIDESSDEDTNEKKKDAVSDNRAETSNENETNETNVIKKTEDVPTVEKELEQPKIKVDIWKKRTVAEVFEEALKRYYERKASRGI
ncbi:nuclear speckle splicing regulatory protein 1 isoform X1 [Pararge aegeria]|uniref:Jg11500 protein n=1 Tax=Pararge aegeria aegeria TaxID=348720 RepID=A0A8S4RPD6_9NEOP|nr:nuclear speckle splicing regulatory protein 1 isoform X1 [Pararge aegeria]CAH2238219.1 jg11500 [Pararge aegeria aegeria]